VRGELLERACERPDVGVAQVLREVLFDRVSVMTARVLHRGPAVVGQDDEDRAAVVLGADASDEAGRLEPVDDAGEAARSLTPGSFALGPKGVPHTFFGETDGAKALIGFQPFQFEGFLREVGDGRWSAYCHRCSPLPRTWRGCSRSPSATG
jgi:hypothetical protein